MISKTDHIDLMMQNLVLINSVFLIDIQIKRLVCISRFKGYNQTAIDDSQSSITVHFDVNDRPVWVKHFGSRPSYGP